MEAQCIQADRQTKKSPLTMMQDLTGQHRKHLIARMDSPGPHRKTRNRQSCRTYGPEVEQAISVIAETLDWIYAERLTPVLAVTAMGGVFNGIGYVTS